jgi:hypothetical protein
LSLRGDYNFIRASLLHPNGRAYKTFCCSIAKAKCGKARRSKATELIGFVGGFLGTSILHLRRILNICIIELFARIN